jgi:hypothetical protein
MWRWPQALVGVRAKLLCHPQTPNRTLLHAEKEANARTRQSTDWTSSEAGWGFLMPKAVTPDCLIATSWIVASFN